MAAHNNLKSNSLGYWIFRINREMFYVFSNRLKSLGVTGAEWALLSEIGERSATPLEIAKIIGVDRAAISRLIDQLEEKSLLRRMKHPSDGRSTVLVLTNAGKELLPKLIAVSKETNQLFLKLLPPDDAKNLLDLVRTLGERLPMNEIAGDSCDL